MNQKDRSWCIDLESHAVKFKIPSLFRICGINDDFQFIDTDAAGGFGKVDFLAGDFEGIEKPQIVFASEFSHLMSIEEHAVDFWCVGQALGQVVTVPGGDEEFGFPWHQGNGHLLVALLLIAIVASDDDGGVVSAGRAPLMDDARLGVGENSGVGIGFNADGIGGA